MLQRVQGGSYKPERDAGPWVRFCVAAHLEQTERAAKRWSDLDELVASRQWPDRLVIALEQSLFEGVDRKTYAAEADVSASTATTDLRRLADAGLLTQHGRARSTRFTASTDLRARVDR